MLYDIPYQWNIIWLLCNTLNPSCIHSVRNCKVDLSALGFEMCTESAFSLPRARSTTLAPCLRHGHCLQLHPPAQLHLNVEIHIDQISPPSWNACAGVCVDPNRLRCSREFDFSSSAIPGSSIVHIIHPCCKLAVVPIRVLVSRPRSLPSCSRAKL